MATATKSPAPETVEQPTPSTEQPTATVRPSQELTLIINEFKTGMRADLKGRTNAIIVGVAGRNAVGTEVLMLSDKQADALARSAGIHTGGAQAWASLSMLCGINDSAVHCSVTPFAAGDVFINTDGLPVEHLTSGVSCLPQRIELSAAVRMQFVTAVVKEVVKGFQSSASFKPTIAAGASED